MKRCYRVKQKPCGECGSYRTHSKACWNKKHVYPSDPSRKHWHVHCMKCNAITLAFTQRK